eukprot:TRINITY_DN3271_c0_g1_i2.p1 TRINITY_DN3271_c0_g1~~TRINITY_DN3271_c0_g1_i2.p1  ORF type:complete len:451 (-),score=71.96 TRINITY_DN3271_c0_g1_i2:32-1384(-)
MVGLHLYEGGNSVASIVALGRTCSTLNNMVNTQLNTLWEQLYRRDFPGDFFPEPQIDTPIGCKWLKTKNDWEKILEYMERDWRRPGAKLYYFPSHWWTSIDAFFQLDNYYNNNKPAKFAAYLASHNPHHNQDEWEYMHVPEEVATKLMTLPLYELTGRTDLLYSFSSHMYCDSNVRPFFKKFFWKTPNNRQSYINRYKYMIRSHNAQYEFEDACQLHNTNWELENTIDLSFKQVLVTHEYFCIKYNTNANPSLQESLAFLFRDFFLENLQLEEPILQLWYEDFMDEVNCLFIFPHIQENLALKGSQMLEKIFSSYGEEWWSTSNLDFGLYISEKFVENSVTCMEIFAWGQDFEEYLARAIPKWQAENDPSGAFILSAGKRTATIYLPEEEEDAPSGGKSILLDNFYGYGLCDSKSEFYRQQVAQLNYRNIEDGILNATHAAIVANGRRRR